MRINPVGLPTIPEVIVEPEIIRTQSMSEERQTNTGPVISIEAARLERAIRSARVAEAMNLQIYVEESPAPVQEDRTWAQKIVRTIAIAAGIAAVPSAIVPLVYGPIAIPIPLGLAAMFVGGVSLTRKQQLDIPNQEYIGP